MLESGITQSELSRLSGVHQPSISQFLSGRVELSDEQLDRLLSCMGYRLEVVRRPVRVELTRSERRSWLLHRRLSSHLTRQSLEQWRPRIECYQPFYPGDRMFINEKLINIVPKSFSIGKGHHITVENFFRNQDGDLCYKDSRTVFRYRVDA